MIQTLVRTTPARLPTEARRAEIVAAALRLAQDRSPSSISTTDLARAVGVSQGALFKHFATKDAIWLAAMVWTEQQLLHTLDAAAAQAGSPLDALARVFDAHVGFVITHSGVPRTIFHELQQPMDSPIKQQVRSLMQGYRRLLMRLLDAAVQSGDAAADLDTAAAATQFVGMVQGLVMQSMISGQVSSMSTEAARVFALYLRGIHATP